MQYSGEDGEMQPQHNNKAGGLFTECNKRTRNEKKEGKSEGFKEICQLLNLPLASIGHPQKFIRDAVTYIFLSQLSLRPLKALNPDLKSM